MTLLCSTDLRRDAVRRFAGRNGLDYCEVGADQRSLRVYFLGKLPPELAKDGPGLERHFAIEGGDIVTGIRVLDADPTADPDPERDDFVLLRLDRAGDFSTYSLRLVNVENIDPHYESISFSFKIDCPSEFDCGDAADCPPAPLDEPRLNYLAKDYASFRQLLLDRLALLVPDWTERHVPDLGITLVELLAYVADYLSYYQDAVTTEAYLGTARQRISVRRHARLVDYRLHEGCNARAWVHVRVGADPPPLAAGAVAFVTALDPSFGPPERPLARATLASLPPSRAEWFEPLADPATELVFRAAHNEIALYDWGLRDCCLAKGATRATLVDGWDGDGRTLALQPGDALLFEEVFGARTGEPADADPKRRWVVTLTAVTPAEDPLFPVEDGYGRRPAALLEVEWAAADALPFALCLSAIGAAPDCRRIDGVTVARGNIVLVDHGRTVSEPLPPVPGEIVSACCECAGQPAEIVRRATRFRPRLAGSPLVHGAPWARGPASAALAQDARCALPAITLAERGGAVWRAAADLLASDADARAFVVEIDNDGTAILRFGDGTLARSPDVGMVLDADYRVGGGAAGNVGAEAISRIVLDGITVDGVDFAVRNPLAAAGGADPEPIAQAKLHAPAAFRRDQRRAITADDYAAIAARDPALQRAAGALVWTGSWCEANVAIDPLHGETADPALIAALQATLGRYRRIGHDLRVRGAAYVPITVVIEVCAGAGYDRGHLRRALVARFLGPDGLFQPDRLSFGEGVYLSRLVAAAMAVPGVECATVTTLKRQFQPPAGELGAGVLPLAAHEIARLDNDPDHPERGQLTLTVRGGRQEGRR